jgi:hypothetical protein
MSARAIKARFYIQQINNALSPSNFPLTNPEVLKETAASNAENLVRGMLMLAEDIEAWQGIAEAAPDRSIAFQDRREYRHHTRQGHIPERYLPGHPVRADGGFSAEAAAAHRAALDQ